MAFNTLRLGINMNQGATFSQVILVKDADGPINITDYEFFGEMKTTTAEDSNIVAEFDFEILDQTSNTGQVRWTLTAEDSAAIDASVSDAERKARLTTPYVFDIKMIDAVEFTSRIIEGIVYLSPQVTLEPPVPEP